MLSKVILQSNVDKVAKLFERADKVVITTHISPDGDAVGSSLGLLHFLESQGKEVHIIVPNAFPDFLRWMPGAKDIVRYDMYSDFANQLISEADVICCLDYYLFHCWFAPAWVYGCKWTFIWTLVLVWAVL